MRRNLFRLSTLAIAASMLVTSCDQEPIDAVKSESMATESQIIPDQYIVVYKRSHSSISGRISKGNSASSARAISSYTNEIFQSRGLRTPQLKHVFTQTIAGAVMSLNRSELETIRNDDRIEYIEQDRIITLGKPTNPGGGNGGGGSTPPPQETPWGISRVNGVSSYSGSSVAWVIDSGIDLDHPDLNVDANRSVSFITQGGSTGPDDQHGHGTHVAGTIAAINNSRGVIGVAPGATVIAVRVLDRRGSGSYSGVIAGVEHVGANGTAGDVANMSLGGPVSQALDDAVVAASSNGIKFVLAAGNESDNANNHSPARANGNNIYTISAMSQGDNWASFSNYGNPPVDYCAPGVSIKSTWKGGDYNTISGTSMASPHAAGVLLLGAAKASGSVNGDPDGNSDTIISH
jgi:hypothetical protein